MDLDAFTQKEPGRPREDWQAPWMEQWCSESGERIVTEPFDPPPDDLTSSRVVFFLHHISFGRPLLTPAGEAALPATTPLPPRLSAVEYEPVD